jgi:hypothetical protein
LKKILMKKNKKETPATGSSTSQAIPTGVLLSQKKKKKKVVNTCNWLLDFESDSNKAFSSSSSPPRSPSPPIP